MTTHTAACCCGELQVVTRGEPLRISVCHCLACQQRTGSAFGAQARYHRDQVVISGESREYQRTADSGRKLCFYFCPNCGSTVYYYIVSDPDVVAVPVGGFADPGFPAPWVSVYESRKHPWVELSITMEHHEESS